MNWFPFTHILDNLITNSIHAWLTKDYRSSGMYIVVHSIDKIMYVSIDNSTIIIRICPRLFSPGGNIEWNTPKLLRTTYTFLFQMEQRHQHRRAQHPVQQRLCTCQHYWQLQVRRNRCGAFDVNLLRFSFYVNRIYTDAKLIFIVTTHLLNR